MRVAYRVGAVRGGRREGKLQRHRVKILFRVQLLLQSLLHSHIRSHCGTVATFADSDASYSPTMCPSGLRMAATCVNQSAKYDSSCTICTSQTIPSNLAVKRVSDRAVECCAQPQ